MPPEQLLSLLLQILRDPKSDTRLGRGQHYFYEAVQSSAARDGHNPTQQQVMEAVWSLVGQGLAYIDFTQGAVENWKLRLTCGGSAAADDTDYNPNDPGGYLTQLDSSVPNMTPLAREYAEEALRAYNHRLYRSSAVMLGVASEASVLHVAQAFSCALPAKEAEKFSHVINRRKTNFVEKLNAFAEKLRGNYHLLPDELSDGLDLNINAVADLLRAVRNAAGHPTGRRLDRGDCFVHLQMFIRYMQKLYALETHLQSQGHSGPEEQGS